MLYQSDITKFLNCLKKQKPLTENEQMQGRALLWGKDLVDLNKYNLEDNSRVKQTSYVYYQIF